MNILTFDIEDWFHILDNTSTKTEKDWSNFESRIYKNTERILDLLNEKNQKATFFCLGWIALKYPEVIRNIIDQGNEIGSHGNMHQLFYEQGKQKFKSDLYYSIKLLEDVSGKKIKYCYHVSTFMN